MASETTVKESETTVSDVDTTEQDGDGLSPPSDAFTGWFASSTLRLGLVLVGFFLLLAALGQLSGVDILGLTAELLGTDVGRWLLVAVVALALISVAVHGFTGRSD
ncbi:hypothetical protein ACH9L7_06410 [Haloferax sp. S1W]|uniref:hypothetical protein n=1 Tax=Haloferax sp. S1W TaxID=3377110 RepID=UPI0037C9D476